MTAALVLLVLLVLWTVASRNRFVRQTELVQESWRQVGLEERRRAELVPDLVDTVRAGGTGSPDLMADLLARLTDTEDRLAAARRLHAGNVRALNTRVAAFPSCLVARAFGVEWAAYQDETAEDEPSVLGEPAGLEQLERDRQHRDADDDQGEHLEVVADERHVAQVVAQQRDAGAPQHAADDVPAEELER